MVYALILAAAVSTQPTPEQTKLLEVFRSEFIEITPGKGRYPREFTMGRATDGRKNETPQHKVVFGYSFHINKYEVPQNLWTAVMGNNPSRWPGERNSVEKLSFAEAEQFCQKATQLMRSAKLIEANQVIRLPSEAEWEYVARAGTKTAYSFGDSEDDLGPYAWFTGNAAGNDPAVGELKPNPWGLYDIHGYLWEWCQDTGEDYTKDDGDGQPVIKADAKSRVLRGGSWKDKASMLTSSYRLIAPADTRDDAVGLRCVLSKEAKK